MWNFITAAVAAWRCHIVWSRLARNDKIQNKIKNSMSPSVWPVHRLFPLRRVFCGYTDFAFSAFHPSSHRHYPVNTKHFLPTSVQPQALAPPWHAYSVISLLCSLNHFPMVRKSELLFRFFFFDTNTKQAHRNTRLGFFGNP